MRNTDRLLILFVGALLTIGAGTIVGYLIAAPQDQPGKDAHSAYVAAYRSAKQSAAKKRDKEEFRLGQRDGFRAARAAAQDQADLAQARAEQLQQDQQDAADQQALELQTRRQQSTRPSHRSTGPVAPIIQVPSGRAKSPTPPSATPAPQAQHTEKVTGGHSDNSSGGASAPGGPSLGP